MKDLLHRCLQKDPRERLHDIADARIEIGESLGQPLETVTVARRFSLGWLDRWRWPSLFSPVS